MSFKKIDFPTFTTATNNVNITSPGIWYLYGSSATTAILPPSTAIRGTELAIFRIVAVGTAGPVTISRSSADTINVNGSSTVTNFVLLPGESVDMAYSGITWVAIFGASNSARFNKYKNVSATTNTLDRSASFWTYSGATATTWTLPSISLNPGVEYTIKNRGSMDLTLQRAGADQIYTTSLVNSITVMPGNSLKIINDGINWSVV